MAAAAMPWITRPATSCSTPPASAATTEPTSSRTPPPRKTARRPLRSPSRPPTMIRAPARKYPLTAHWRESIEPLNSRPIEGNAILMSVAVSQTRKVKPQRPARDHQRLGLADTAALSSPEFKRTETYWRRRTMEGDRPQPDGVRPPD